MGDAYLNLISNSKALQTLQWPRQLSKVNLHVIYMPGHLVPLGKSARGLLSGGLGGGREGPT